MKIVHMCLGCFYPDNYSYQENMLPKYHKQLGFEVEVIASLMSFDINGKPTYLKKAGSYYNEHAIRVTRLEYKKPCYIFRKLKGYIGTYDALEQSAPNILFIHGCQFLDINIVVKYIQKHPDTKVYVDNHADFSNSATNLFSREILHKCLWRTMAHKIEPYTQKFYGVLPARVDWLIQMYKLPKAKCELLVMGADDDKVEEAYSNKWRSVIRNEYGISEDDFLIITGGKIDSAKKQTLLLMDAVQKLNDQKVRLIVFGSVTPEMRNAVENLSDGVRVQYIGWVDSEKTYRYWAAADAVAFPGRHSVFWEQVAGMGIPMLCKYWVGTTHVDIGGNVLFVHEDSEKAWESALDMVSHNCEAFDKMTRVAAGQGKRMFSYKEIAKRAIEI